MDVILADALLECIIEADFKTVKKKFLKQGFDKELIEDVLQDFKDLKNKQRIKNAEEKNIDYWGKYSFIKLKNYVMDLKATKSKTEETKIKKSQGAKLIGENDDWLVYEITSHDSACFYGAKTKWCITERDGKHWNRYVEFNDFYYLISKTRPETDPFYKIAVNVNKKNKKPQFWDAKDNTLNSKKIKEIKRDLPKNVKQLFTKQGLRSAAALITALNAVLSESKPHGAPSLKPPSEWFDAMVSKIRKGNPSYSEERIRKTVGDIWYNELTDAKRKEIRERYGKKYGKAS